MLTAAVVDVMDMIRMLRAAPGTGARQTHVLDEGEAPSGSAGDSVVGQRFAALAGATTADQSLINGRASCHVASFWHDDVTTAHHRTVDQAYSVFMFQCGTWRFPIALAPKGGLMAIEVLRWLAIQIERIESGFTVFDVELGLIVPVKVAVITSASDRIAANSFLWWSQGSGTFCLVAGWLGDSRTWNVLPSCDACRWRRRQQLAGVVVVAAADLCPGCADWDMSRIPYTETNVLGIPHQAHPRRADGTTVNRAILVVWEAAKLNRATPGGIGLTRASALQFLQVQGLATGPRAEAVDRALANHPNGPLLHPVASKLGRGFLFSVSHQLHLGILKAFLADLASAMAKQHLGARFTRASRDLLRDAPVGVAWFQAAAVGSHPSFVGSQLAAVLRSLPWIIGQVAERDPGLQLTAKNAVVIEVVSALCCLGGLLSTRVVTPAAVCATDRMAKHFLDCIRQFETMLLPPKCGRFSDFILF